MMKQYNIDMKQEIKETVVMIYFGLFLMPIPLLLVVFIKSIALSYLISIFAFCLSLMLVYYITKKRIKKQVKEITKTTIISDSILKRDLGDITNEDFRKFLEAHSKKHRAFADLAIIINDIKKREEYLDKKKKRRKKFDKLYRSQESIFDFLTYSHLMQMNFVFHIIILIVINLHKIQNEIIFKSERHAKKLN